MLSASCSLCFDPKVSFFGSAFSVWQHASSRSTSNFDQAQTKSSFSSFHYGDRSPAHGVEWTVDGLKSPEDCKSSLCIIHEKDLQTDVEWVEKKIFEGCMHCTFLKRSKKQLRQRFAFGLLP